MTSKNRLPKFWMTDDILAAFHREFQMSTREILITGAMGDSGDYAIERLLERGREVGALAAMRDERSEKLCQRGVEVVYGETGALVSLRHSLTIFA